MIKQTALALLLLLLLTSAAFAMWGRMSVGGTVLVSLPATASLSASPTSVTSGSSSTLTWSSTNAPSCTGTGFSTGGATSGTASTGPLTVVTSYSVNCGGAVASATVNITPGGGGGGGAATFVLAIQPENPTSQPPAGGWCRQIGRCPETTFANGYTGPGGSGSDPANNGGYPSSVVDAWQGGGCDRATLGNNYTYANVTAGACDTLFTQQDNVIINYARAGHMRMIRWDDEWMDGYEGDPTSPFCTPASTNNCPLDAPQTLSTPSLWSNFWRHRFQLARANFAAAGVPAPPFSMGMPMQANEIPFWNFDDLVDLGSTDAYIDPNPNDTSVTEWEFFCGQDAIPCATSSWYGFLVAFAAQHNKPLYIGEWGDCEIYGDGYIMGKMTEWMFNGNVVGADYWNGNLFGSNGSDCTITLNSARLTAFQNAFATAFNPTAGFWSNSWANWGTNALSGGGALPGCPVGTSSVSAGCGSGNPFW